MFKLLAIGLTTIILVLWLISEGEVMKAAILLPAVLTFAVAITADEEQI